MPVDEASENPIRDVIPLLIDVQLGLDREISLESLARQSGYSPFHFHRLFSNAVGETPKRHVDRLRLERAAYKLAVHGDSVLQIALSVGFKNHETFSRAFKRAFGCSPRDYRRAARAAQDQRSKCSGASNGRQFRVSDVRFVTLPAMTLLAIRRYGAYADLPTPFQEDDGLFTALVDWARRHNVPCRPLPVVISYDDPGLTPKALQRLDACIPVVGSVAAEGRIRRLDFPGGRYGAVEHTGPLSTVDRAYHHLADGIRRSRRYVFDEGPPVQIYRKIHVGGDPAANLTEVYFPVRPAGGPGASRPARNVKNSRGGPV
jgi:AraC family transcriptional regulator